MAVKSWEVTFTMPVMVRVVLFLSWTISNMQSPSRQCAGTSMKHGTEERNTLTANEALDIVDRPFWIGSSLVLGGFTDEMFLVCERHIGRCDAVAQVIGDNLHTPMFVHSHARVPAPLLGYVRQC